MKIEELEKLLISKDGQPIDIPFGGSLGLLALGDIGLIAWRLKREQIIKKEIERRNNAR